MTDASTITLLKAIADQDGSDLFKTTGKTPIWRRADIEIARQLEADGLVVVDEGTAPYGRVGRSIVLGQGWASLTDAGRSAITSSVEG